MEFCADMEFAPTETIRVGIGRYAQKMPPRMSPSASFKSGSEFVLILCAFFPAVVVCSLRPWSLRSKRPSRATTPAMFVSVGRLS